MQHKYVGIKKIIKYSFGKIIGVENSQIEQAIRQAEIVSFDIFDTLVKRNVNMPEDVHELVHKEYLERTGIDICEYQKLRLNAEKEARKYSKKEEVTLEDIFTFLNVESESGKNKLREIEEEIEITICCPSLRMKEVYEYALKEGKRIIITSDMYLDKKVIKEILIKCGYDNFEKLYVSSDYGLCKTTGSIYEVIKKDYAMLHGKILHIGDNVKSDYLIPKSKGLEALLIDGQKNLLRYWQKTNKEVKDQLLYGRLYSFLNNHIADNGGAVEHIGYEILGPMLLGYCTWLNENMQRDNIEKIFFLSREGKILQEAFNILYPKNKIPQTYLYVSRQALVVPLLADVHDFDEMVETLKVFLHVPVLKTICILCDLNREKFNEELTYIGLNEETRIYEIANEHKEEVYGIIQKMGGHKFKLQKRYVLRYLKENDFTGNVAIADIGWTGTMQMALQKYISKSDTVIHGYYLGVRNMEEDNYYTCFHRNGYLFEPGINKEFDLMIRFTTEIFEILLLNRAGSVKEYSLENNRITPVLAESEYCGDEGVNLEAIQSKALFFLNIIKGDVLFKKTLRLPENIPMAAYAYFAVFPTMDTIMIYEKFHFLTDGNVRKLLPDHGFFYYMFHFQELKRDLNECLCKIFFLKKLFKVNFSYFHFLKLLVLKCNVKSEFRRRYYITQKSCVK